MFIELVLDLINHLFLHLLELSDLLGLLDRLRLLIQHLLHLRLQFIFLAILELVHALLQLLLLHLLLLDIVLHLLGLDLRLTKLIKGLRVYYLLFTSARSRLSGIGLLGDLQLNVLKICLDFHIHFQTLFDIIIDLLTMKTQNNTIESSIEFVLQAFQDPLLKSLGYLIICSLDFLFKYHLPSIIICLKEAIVLIFEHFKLFPCNLY